MTHIIIINIYCYNKYIYYYYHCVFFILRPVTADLLTEICIKNKCL